jgi:hypothetical protein
MVNLCIKLLNLYKMENTVLHKADTRGHADHGWLQANFSFSLVVGTILTEYNLGTSRFKR